MIYFVAFKGICRLIIMFLCYSVESVERSAVFIFGHEILNAIEWLYLIQLCLHVDALVTRSLVFVSTGKILCI
jgi:hypothetical protein